MGPGPRLFRTCFSPDMQFSQMGLVDLHTQRTLDTPTEEHVFDMLGLPWMPPTLRNADP